ncbi:MAG: hypothetical protein AAGF84_03315 [Planctomycetota bacterium]
MDPTTMPQRFHRQPHFGPSAPRSSHGGGRTFRPSTAALVLTLAAAGSPLFLIGCGTTTGSGVAPTAAVSAVPAADGSLVLQLDAADFTPAADVPLPRSLQRRWAGQQLTPSDAADAEHTLDVRLAPPRKLDRGRRDPLAAESPREATLTFPADQATEHTAGRSPIAVLERPAVTLTFVTPPAAPGDTPLRTGLARITFDADFVDAALELDAQARPVDALWLALRGVTTTDLRRLHAARAPISLHDAARLADAGIDPVGLREMERSGTIFVIDEWLTLAAAGMTTSEALGFVHAGTKPTVAALTDAQAAKQQAILAAVLEAEAAQKARIESEAVERAVAEAEAEAERLEQEALATQAENTESAEPAEMSPAVSDATTDAEVQAEAKAENETDIDASMEAAAPAVAVVAVDEASEPHVEEAEAIAEPEAAADASNDSVEVAATTDAPEVDASPSDEPLVMESADVEEQAHETADAALIAAPVAVATTSEVASAEPQPTYYETVMADVSASADAPAAETSEATEALEFPETADALEAEAEPIVADDVVAEPAAVATETPASEAIVEKAVAEPQPSYYETVMADLSAPTDEPVAELPEATESPEASDTSDALETEATAAAEASVVEEETPSLAAAAVAAPVVETKPAESPPSFYDTVIADLTTGSSEADDTQKATAATTAATTPAVATEIAEPDDAELLAAPQAADADPADDLADAAPTSEDPAVPVDAAQDDRPVDPATQSELPRIAAGDMVPTEPAERAVPTQYTELLGRLGITRPAHVSALYESRVPPKLIHQFQRAGVRPSVIELIDAHRLELDPAVAQTLTDAGYDITIYDLAVLDRAGVDPSYAAALFDDRFRPLTATQIAELWEKRVSVTDIRSAREKALATPMSNLDGN